MDYPKKDFLMSFSNNFLIDLPAASNLYFLWNFGSLVAFTLFMQIITGFFLSLHYSNNASLAFNSIIHIIRDVNSGWLIRSIHANGSSLFFLLTYIHISRSMIFGSYKNFKPWTIGVLMMLLMMGTAFLGYVLPWGQMSFWGATVITNMVSAIPMAGHPLVLWLWGGFSVDNPTLNRFFSFHFLLPFILLMLTFLHLIYLHEFGSNNPLGISSNADKIFFHPLYSIKDLFGFFLIFSIFFSVCLLYPYSLMDPENFMIANPLATPEHIQPEWYFLFAYTILRSIPNKFGGVLGLLFSILVFIPYGFIMNSSSFISPLNYPTKYLLSLFLWSFFILTWIGMMPVDFPFEMIGKLSTLMYFILLGIIFFKTMVIDLIYL